MMATSIPEIYQITPEPEVPPDFNRFLYELNATLESGIKLVQLRAKNLNRREYLHVAKLTLDICREHGALLIFNGPVEMALEAGCDGVHLNSQTLMLCQKRPPQGNFLVSAACHDRAQIAHAEKLGVDFITLSPVFPTKTHPESIPMGWQHFAELVAGLRIPVFALGGMDPELIEEAKGNGAWGIAAISATWRSAASIQ